MRHRQRHVHATIVALVRATLTEGGWMEDDDTGPEDVNFGTVPVTLLDYEPQAAGQTPPMNTVAVSIDHQGEDLAFELGAGLSSCEYTVFIDIYAANEPIGVAIGDDVKDALTDVIVPLRDFNADAAGQVTDAQIEFEAVFVEQVPTATSTLDKRSWRVVKATAVVYF